MVCLGQLSGKRHLSIMLNKEECLIFMVIFSHVYKLGQTQIPSKQGVEILILLKVIFFLLLLDLDMFNPLPIFQLPYTSFMMIRTCRNNALYRVSVWWYTPHPYHTDSTNDQYEVQGLLPRSETMVQRKPYKPKYYCKLKLLKSLLKQSSPVTPVRNCLKLVWSKESNHLASRPTFAGLLCTLS